MAGAQAVLRRRAVAGARQEPVVGPEESLQQVVEAEELDVEIPLVPSFAPFLPVLPEVQLDLERLQQEQEQLVVAHSMRSVRGEPISFPPDAARNRLKPEILRAESEDQT